MIRIFVLLAAIVFACAQCPRQAWCRSALSPRHTGMEPPGGPRQLDMLSGKGPTRTPQGGMGYTDAYGNTMEDRQPEEKKPRQRARPGAYGGYGQKDEKASLPDPKKPEKPLWSFQ